MARRTGRNVSENAAPWIVGVAGAAVVALVIWPWLLVAVGGLAVAALVTSAVRQERAARCERDRHLGRVV
jgi:hypothetical protein